MRTHPGKAYAEALMNRTPWQLWDVRSGKPAEGASTLEALEVLQTAMARPGACSIQACDVLVAPLIIREMCAFPGPWQRSQPMAPS